MTRVMLFVLGSWAASRSRSLTCTAVGVPCAEIRPFTTPGTQGHLLHGVPLSLGCSPWGAGPYRSSRGIDMLPPCRTAPGYRAGMPMSSRGARLWHAAISCCFPTGGPCWQGGAMGSLCYQLASCTCSPQMRPTAVCPFIHNMPGCSRSE